MINKVLVSEQRSCMFIFRFTQYYYDSVETSFIPIEFDTNKTFEGIHQEYASGIPQSEEYYDLVNLYGKCNIVLPDKGVVNILLEEVLNPFYLFQFFSIISWYMTEYEVYATCILVTSLISMTVELIDIKRNLNKLKKMVQYEWNVTVHRLNDEDDIISSQIPSNDLVPGDIFDVPEGAKLPCDAIMLSGSSIINEAMLTGESIPVIKIPLPDDPYQMYDVENCKSYTLFSGTEVIQNKSLGGKDARALVIKTNFDTLKGSLIKSILFPKPNRFSFHADSMKFIGILAILAFIGYIISLPPSLK